MKAHMSFGQLSEDQQNWSLFLFTSSVIFLNFRKAFAFCHVSQKRLKTLGGTANQKFEKNERRKVIHSPCFNITFNQLQKLEVQIGMELSNKKNSATRRKQYMICFVFLRTAKLFDKIVRKAVSRFMVLATNVFVKNIFSPFLM